MRKRGFTLIELLIVLAILGILVGVVAMSIGGLTDTALKRGLASEWQVVQTGMDVYNTQDVAVGTGVAITESLSFALVEAATDAGTFQYYLARDTKYYFSWATAGVTITVRDKVAPDDAKFLYDGTAFTALP